MSTMGAKVGVSVEEENPVDTIPEARDNSCSAQIIPVDQITKQHKSTLWSDEEGNLKIVNHIVRHPCIVFFLILAICLVMCIMLGEIVFKGGNPITEDSNTFDIYDVRSKAYDSIKFAKEEVTNARMVNEVLAVALAQNSSKGDEDLEELRDQELMGDVTYWTFEAETSDGLFSSIETVENMREAETMFTGRGDYEFYCWKLYLPDGSSQCRKPLSALNIYYASTYNSTVAQKVLKELRVPENVELFNSLSYCLEFGMFCNLLPTTITPANISWAISLNEDVTSIIEKWDGEGNLNQNLAELTEFVARMKALVTKKHLVNFFFDEGFNVDNQVSMYSRSIVWWGAPLAGAEMSKSKFGADLQSDYNIRKRYIVDNCLDDMRRISKRKYSSKINSYYFMGALLFDVMIGILLQDAFKALISISLVFIYLRIMIDSWFLAFIGILEIILSIPTAWFLSSVVFQIKYFSLLNTLCLFIVAAIGADDIFVFMDAYNQSAFKGEAVTKSLESRMSWVYRRSGTAMAITSATTCSAFLCTLASPIAGTRAFGLFAALVILMDYVLVMTLFCTAVVIYHNRYEFGYKYLCCCCCFEKERYKDYDPTLSVTENARIKHKSCNDNDGDKISMFFRTKVSAFILNRSNRIKIFVPFIIWTALATYYTTELKPTQTTEEFLAKDHPLQKAITILNERFPISAQDTGTHIHFIWGLSDVDRSGVSQLFDPQYTGKAVFESAFDFNEQCQSLMLEVCDNLKTQDRFKDVIKSSSGGLRSVQCIVDEIGAFHALGSLSKCSEVKSGSWKNDTWQVPEDELYSTIKELIHETSCYDEDFGDMLSYYSNNFGWDGNQLRFIGISFESSKLDPWSVLPEDEVREQYNFLTQIQKELNNKMEGACGSKVTMSDLDQKFIFMNNQEIYRTSAISGSFFGILIAFIVILLSTRRLHIAILATLNICCVLVSVIGAVTMSGWSLGTNESILISILAGFSVDYVVHLSHSYVTAHGSKEDRIKSTFGDMGVSVLSGMITSVMASIPLFLCNLTFFAKFGAFLCYTIAFSWIFANFGFMSAIAEANFLTMKKRN